MAKAKYDKIQKPNEQSPEHGKRDAEHGPDEHGLGALPEPTLPAPPEEPAAATVYPATHVVPDVPPVTNQGTTPECVAYSNAYDQNQQDRPKLGRYNQMDENLFFHEIGGTSNGAYMTAGLDRRKGFGYPEKVNVPASGGYPPQNSTPEPLTHRIASYVQIALNVTALKAALTRNHGVLFIGEWQHSWFHPFLSGKLPAPDYAVGGHAIWCIGWDDRYGFRLHNSWGTIYGVAGDVYLPYAFLLKFFAAYQTTK